MPNRRSIRAIALGLVALGAASCTSDDDASPEPTSAPATSTTTPAGPADDGRLVVGVLLPQTGSGAGPALAEPMFEALRHARDEINEAGGVNGADLVLIEADEGENAATANLGFAELIARDVDAIIGPASSTVALAELDQPVSRGVVTCSPTATALALDDFPDRQLFFRTVPSDSLQMEALAVRAERTGEDMAALAFLDDAYGRGLARALEPALARRNIEVVASVGFRGDEDLTSTVAEVLAGEPDIVAVLADADSGGRFLEGLDDGIRGTSPPWIVVNDAQRSVAQEVIENLSPPVRDRLTGVAPYALAVDTEDSDVVLQQPYAAAAFDCLNLIALAAEQAGSDDSAKIAQNIAAASVGGSACRTFNGCKERLEGDLQIDYDGPSGNTDVSQRGDPLRARFEEFGFNTEGRAVSGPNDQFEVLAGT